MPYKWSRIPAAEVSKVTPLKQRDNGDGTAWVLINTNESSKVHAIESRGPYPTAAAAGSVPDSGST